MKGKTPDPTTLALNVHIKSIIIARESWMREADTIQCLEIYIGSSKTFPEIFGNLFSEKEALVEKTIQYSKQRQSESLEKTLH